MFAAGIAVTLLTALVLEVTGHGRAVSGLFTCAGLVFLVLAICFPPGTRIRLPRRRPLSLHEHVPHPHLAHRKTAGPVKADDQHDRSSAMARFNARFAVVITRSVGSMYCAYVFAAFDLISLPAALKAGTQAIVSWIAQTFLQLVLLSVIMVGQDVQAKAGDARSQQTFLDAEAMIHEQAQAAAHLAAQDETILDILGRVERNTELTAQVHGLVTALSKPPAPKTLAAKPAKGAAT